jgi:hypothetical protein
VGAAGVGKTALRSLLSGYAQRFRVSLEVEELVPLPDPARLRREDVVVVVLDVCAKEAIAALPVLQHRKVVLVANKVDLEYWRVVKGTRLRCAQPLCVRGGGGGACMSALGM